MERQDEKQLQIVAKILLAYEWTKDVSKYPTPGDRKRALREFLQEYEDNRLLMQPYRMMNETIFGKKEGYYSIVLTWKESGYLAEGWTLLALADTIEEMSKMIYESYRELVDLFRKHLNDFIQKKNNIDLLASLAILKACNLGIILPEHYVTYGLKYMGNEEESQDLDLSIENELRKTCKEQYELIIRLWGGHK